MGERTGATGARIRARFMLKEGATFRELARRRAEDLAGWRFCYDALEVAEGRAGAPQ